MKNLSSGRPSILYAAFDAIPSPKGASTHISQFIEALGSRFPDSTLLTPHSDPETVDTTYRGLRHIKAGIIEANLLKRVENFRMFVSAHLRENHYDVVHFRSIWEGIPILEHRTSGRYETIYEVNGLPSIELVYHYPALALSGRSLVRKLKNQELWTMRNCDFIITPSAVTAELMENAGISRSKITLIPNGVDETLFSPSEGGEKNKPFTFLYQGTLAPWQGIDTLLAAFNLVLQGRDARLVILGPRKKSWLRGYQKICRKNDMESSVHFIPPVPHCDVVHHIREADACLAPLDNCMRNMVQGCNPIKLYEYMACRKPIVASDLKVIRQVLEPDAEALLHLPGNAEDLARCMCRIIDDDSLRERLACNAYEKVMANYLWRHSRTRLLRLYEEILEKRAGACL